MTLSSVINLLSIFCCTLFAINLVVLHTAKQMYLTVISGMVYEISHESKFSTTVFSFNSIKISLIVALLVALPHDSICRSMSWLSAATVIIDGFADLCKQLPIKPVFFNLLCTQKIVAIATDMYPQSIILLIFSILSPLFSDNNIHYFDIYIVFRFQVSGE